MPVSIERVDKDEDADENVMLYLSAKRHRSLVNHLKDRLFHFGSLVQYHLMSAKDQSRVHQFGNGSLSWNVPRMRIVRGWKLEG